MERIYYNIGFAVYWFLVGSAGILLALAIWFFFVKKVWFFLKNRTYIGQYYAYTVFKKQVSAWTPDQCWQLYQLLGKRSLEKYIYLHKVYDLIREKLANNQRENYN